MSSKFHTHKKCGILRKKSFSARGYAKIHIQRPFFDNKKDNKKICIENPNSEHIYSNASSIHEKFYF
jgi:hypothetical protein